MRLFIKIVDGQPFEHPITDENFREAFPDVDMNNLPEGFAEFIRVEPPTTNRFEVCEKGAYEKVGDKYTDVYLVRPMTEEEKTEIINKQKAAKPKENWRWDDINCRWLPPKIPTTGGPWKYSPQELDWVVATEPPFPSWVLRGDGLIYVAPISRPPNNQKYYWDEPTLSWVILNV